MSIIEVLNRGARVRHEHGDAAKLTYLQRRSLQRFADLHWSMEARKLNMRTVNRRHRRQAGLPLANVTRKYRTESRRKLESLRCNTGFIARRVNGENASA